MFELEEDKSSSYYVNVFLKEIELRCTSQSLAKSDDLNAYFCPELKKNLLCISRHFPLWSSVMVGYFKSPYSTATSAPVEGDFAELKHRILRHDFKPMSADRFVVTHLQNLESSMKLARSKQLFPKNDKTPSKNSQDLEISGSKTELNIYNIKNLAFVDFHFIFLRAKTH